MPGGEPDVTYAYDNLGRLTSASQTGNSLSFSYDALSRNLNQVGPLGTVASQWDLAGRRTRLTYPGSGLYVDYDYLVTGETTRIRENGATSGVGVLATYAYDDLGRRTSLTFGNGVVQAYNFDLISRLTSLTNELSGTANDLSATFAYNPASQIASTVRTGDAYAWTGHFNENKTGTANGLNQLTQVGAKTLTHDARGNVTAFGTKSFTYSSENLMLTGPNGTTLGYDPAMRLYETASGGTIQRFAYDGLDRIAEYDGANVLQRRYVHGPGIDEPMVTYEGTGTTDRRFLSSDESGSIISVTDSAGTLLGLNRYDEYGNPQSTNLGIWGYTGQAWLPSVGVWYYKARDYDPELGRFLQTDPIGYAGGINLHAYVGNDPVNWADPLGLKWPDNPCPVIHGENGDETVCTGKRPKPDPTPTFNTGPNGSGPIGRGGNSRTLLPKRRPCTPTTAQLENSGEVTYTFAEANASAGLFWAEVEGSFVTSKGYAGHFSTEVRGGFLGAKGLGASVGSGKSMSLATFSGPNFNVIGTLAIVSISDNFDPKTLDHVGQTDAISTPGLGIGATYSETRLRDVVCPTGF